MDDEAQISHDDEARTIQMVVEEHFNAGTRVALLLGLPREVTETQLGRIADHLHHHGMGDAQVQFGTSYNPAGSVLWDNTLRVEFTRPSREAKAQFLPFAFTLIAAMGLVGITAYLGFKVGQVVEQIGRNLVPLALIGVGAVVLIMWMRQRQPMRTARAT